MIAPVAKRLDEALRAMDAQRVDDDASSLARADGAFLYTLLSGTVGLVAATVSVAALAALLIWLFV
jgi:hypothetical protein